jgi:hypothetical protein
MKRSKHRIRRCLVAGVIAGGIVLDLAPAGIKLAPRTAHAVVGRPLTPVSYAGVSRRSSRRVARRTAARTSAYYSTLPSSGCVQYGASYQCGGASYQAAYSGSDVVYVPY